MSQINKDNGTESARYTNSHPTNSFAESSCCLLHKHQDIVGDLGFEKAFNYFRRTGLSVSEIYCNRSMSVCASSSGADKTSGGLDSVRYTSKVDRLLHEAFNDSNKDGSNGNKRRFTIHVPDFLKEKKIGNSSSSSGCNSNGVSRVKYVGHHQNNLDDDVMFRGQRQRSGSCHDQLPSNPYLIPLPQSSHSFTNPNGRFLNNDPMARPNCAASQFSHSYIQQRSEPCDYSLANQRYNNIPIPPLNPRPMGYMHLDRRDTSSDTCSASDQQYRQRVGSTFSDLSSHSQTSRISSDMSVSHDFNEPINLQQRRDRVSTAGALLSASTSVKQEPNSYPSSPRSTTSTNSTSIPMAGLKLLDKDDSRTITNHSPVSVASKRKLDLQFNSRGFNQLTNKILRELMLGDGEDDESANKVLRMSEEQDIFNLALMQKHSQTIALLENIGDSEFSDLYPTDYQHVNYVKDLLKSCVCGNLTFSNPLKMNQDLSKTLLEQNVDWTPVVNQLDIFTVPIIKFAAAFLNSAFVNDNSMTADDRSLLLRSRFHACQSALFTPLFNQRDCTMTVLIDGRHYLVAANRSTQKLVARLPSECQSVNKVESYKCHLSNISEKDMTIIALYGILKLSDVGTSKEGTISDEMYSQSRLIFVEAAKLLKRYCIHKFGVEKGSDKFSSLIRLFEWAFPFDYSVKSLFNHVSVKVKHPSDC